MVEKGVVMTKGAIQISYDNRRWKAFRGNIHCQLLV